MPNSWADGIQLPALPVEDGGVIHNGVALILHTNLFAPFQRAIKIIRQEFFRYGRKV